MKIMKVYLAAAWHRKDEMKKLSLELSKLPYVKVNSRWLNESGNLNNLPMNVYLKEHAEKDLQDVLNCDTLVRFTDSEYTQGYTSNGKIDAKLASGARMVEMGYALAHQKNVIVVGGYQPIFDYLPQVLHVSTVEELKSILKSVSMGMYIGTPPFNPPPPGLGSASKATSVNPKDLIGEKKVSLSKLPAVAVAHAAHAMMDGATKYGPFNWRSKKVQAHIYIDAAKRHMDSWFEGELVARDSKVHHLGHAIACLAILLDAETTGNLIDDRPIVGDSTLHYQDTLNTISEIIQENYLEKGEINAKH